MNHSIQIIKLNYFTIFRQKYFNDTCPICFDSLSIHTRLITCCNHTFCNDCFKHYISLQKSINKINCPCCRQKN